MSYSKSAKNILERARNLQTGKIKILSIRIKAKNILYSARKIFGDRPKKYIKGGIPNKDCVYQHQLGVPRSCSHRFRVPVAARSGISFLDDNFDLFHCTTRSRSTVSGFLFFSLYLMNYL